MFLDFYFRLYDNNLLFFRSFGDVQSVIIDVCNQANNVFGDGWCGGEEGVWDGEVEGIFLLDDFFVFEFGLRYV